MYNVVIYSNGLPTAVGKAKHLNLLGTFVEMPPDMVRKHHIVVVEFNELKESGSRYRLTAMVQAQRPNGVQLIFESSDPSTQETIRALTQNRRDGEQEYRQAAWA